MEITRHNFKQVIDQVSEAVDEASFLCIDGEFTGLNNGPVLHGFDTPQERYDKLRKGSLDFLFVQFGLCAFKYETEESRFVARPFNFYIFPRPLNRNAPDCRFLCQASSLHFLASQGMDFNKVFRDGIPYLSPVDEQQMRDTLDQKHATQQLNSPPFTSGTSQTSDSSRSIQVPAEHKDFIQQTVTRIQSFIDSEEESLQLEPCNAYLRKLIYSTVKNKFSSSVYLETKVGEQNQHYFIEVSKANEEVLKKRGEEKRQQELDELDDAVGMSKIIKMICQSGKLVIGHNMLLDVLHLVHKFSYPLPQEIDEFKSLVNCLFPRLLDTKLMASMHPFKELVSNTTLGDLEATLGKEPFKVPVIVFPEDFPGYETAQEHQAGYDAYITGRCFTIMANYLGKFKSQSKPALPGSALLEPFVNKLYLMRVQDIPYVNLTGQDLKPNRDHVFHVTFPKEWKSNDLYQLFRPFGPIYIAWIDDVSAFVALNKKDQSDLAYKMLCEGVSYRVRRYGDHKDPNTSHGRKRPLSLPETFAPWNGEGKRLKVTSSDVGRRVSPVTQRCITTILEEAEDKPTTEAGGEGEEHPEEDGDEDENGDEMKEEKSEEKTNEAPQAPLFEEPEAW
ncbi:poly(A)-specific ribonuclease PARN-like isoform X1 [Branchiostoma floridae x Branchiostoma japonicum]